MIFVRMNPGATHQRNCEQPSITNFGTAQPFGPANGYSRFQSPVAVAVWAMGDSSLRTAVRPAIQQRFVRFSRLPVDSVLLEICIHRAADGRIEVFGAEAIK